jgi:hypothetical protein
MKKTLLLVVAIASLIACRKKQDNQAKQITLDGKWQMGDYVMNNFWTSSQWLPAIPQGITSAFHITGHQMENYHVAIPDDDSPCSIQAYLMTRGTFSINRLDTSFTFVVSGGHLRGFRQTCPSDPDVNRPLDPSEFGAPRKYHWRITKENGKTFLHLRYALDPSLTYTLEKMD